MNWLQSPTHLFALAIGSFLLTLLVLLSLKLIRDRRIVSVITPNKLRPYVREEVVWSLGDLEIFLKHCTVDQKTSLLETLGETESNKPIGLSYQIRRALLRHSTHAIIFKFKDVDSLDYHKVVVWVAKKCGILQEKISSASTFELEKLIMGACFRDMWDSLNNAQRRELMRKIDTKRQFEKVDVAGMSGTAALALLNASVYFCGFSFYTTMSTLICSAAGIFGVTLPFSTYIGASMTTAFLTGPVGVVLLTIGAAGSLAFLGKANWRKTMAFIVAMHCLKAEALHS